jgi:hypothetical protein
MRKKFAIVLAIAVIMVSAAVAITVANMSDDLGNVQRYEINDMKTYFYDSMIAQSTISSLEVNETEIKYDDGAVDFGITMDLTDVGHAVLFSPPTKSWTLDKVKVVGEYVNHSEGRIFALEIWDGNCSLLYKLTDYSQAYFLNTEDEWTEIDIPDINITNDFYICIFERGSLYVGMDTDNPAMRSYYVVRRGPNHMVNATYLLEQPDTEKPFNWMIRAVGS